MAIDRFSTHGMKPAVGCARLTNLTRRQNEPPARSQVPSPSLQANCCFLTLTCTDIKVADRIAFAPKVATGGKRRLQIS
ncbi:hypothetical protein ZHAS_00000400 [Anopheles sinensis]|uniref:Uncharacterized protein n=1 Tax=Anopheles sinensis TaxID=74873 RepID=A0A084VA62_ANOSI|nr:hypothetical protein ZHAS_00000400 [Anopheles sinensis]